MTPPPNESGSDRGRDFEGYAFTFCKTAFLALLFSRYTLLLTSFLAAIFYTAAYCYGVREWRCFVKPPWVIMFFLCVTIAQAYLLFWPHPPKFW